MKIEKLENALNSGSFHSDISPEALLALKAKLKKSSTKKTNSNLSVVKPMLDFDGINQEALKLASSEVKYPKRLPKGVVISVRKKPQVDTQ